MGETRKPHWYQLRMRTLLVMVIVVGALLGVCIRSMPQDAELMELLCAYWYLPLLGLFVLFCIAFFS